MIPWGKVLAAAMRGGLLGVVAIGLVTLLFWALFSPAAMNDGQFAMVFFISGPFGAMLGAVAAVALALITLGQTAFGGWTSLTGGAIIAGLAVWFTFLWFGNRPPEEGGVLYFLRLLVLPAYGAPFVWAVIEMVWGIYLLRQ